jgi:hypothetical protein
MLPVIFLACDPSEHHRDEHAAYLFAAAVVRTRDQEIKRSGDQEIRRSEDWELFWFEEPSLLTS